MSDIMKRGAESSFNHYMTLCDLARETMRRLTDFQPMAVPDEVSLLFLRQPVLQAFAEEAKRRDLWFNNSFEHQEEMGGVGQNFDTQFEFFWPHRNAEYRIEAMTVLDGEAPLHTAQMNQYGEISVVHVSWKLSDEDHYNAQIYEMLRLGLRPQKEYRNGYGVFSYWPLRNEKGEVLFYMKPRYNTRDA